MVEQCVWIFWPTWTHPSLQGIVQVWTTENRRLSYIRLGHGGTEPPSPDGYPHALASTIRRPARVGSKTRFQARRSVLLCHHCPLPPQCEGLESPGTPHHLLVLLLATVLTWSLASSARRLVLDVS